MDGAAKGIHYDIPEETPHEDTPDVEEKDLNPNPRSWEVYTT